MLPLYPTVAAADPWVTPDFSTGTKTDPGSWEAGITATTVTVDTSVAGAAADPTSAQVDTYGRRLLTITPEATGPVMLIVEMDFSSAEQADGVVVGLVVSGTTDLSDVYQWGGWQDDSGGFRLRSGGQTQAGNILETKADADRMRIVMAWDGNQDRCQVAAVCWSGDDDDDASSRMTGKTAEAALDITTACTLSLIYGTRNPVDVGDQTVTFACRYQWVDLEPAS